MKTTSLFIGTILILTAPVSVYAQASHQYLPLAVGNHWTQRSDSLSGVYNPTTWYREITGTDSIRGIEYFRVRFIIANTDGHFKNVNWYTWMRYDTAGIVMSAFGDTSLVDSAKIFPEPVMFIPDSVLPVGYTWGFYEEVWGGQITITVQSIDDSIQVPVGTFHNCLVLDLSVVNDSGNTTRSDLLYYAPGVGEVANIGYMEWMGTYRFELIEYNVAAVSVEPSPSGQIPQEYRLLQNYPNPFNPSTTLRYDLPQRAEVLLTIYDILGREVARLVHGSQRPGYHQVTWNGRTTNDREVPSGIYIARLMTPEYTQSIKLLFLK